MHYALYMVHGAHAHAACAIYSAARASRPHAVDFVGLPSLISGVSDYSDFNEDVCSTTYGKCNVMCVCLIHVIAPAFLPAVCYIVYWL